MSKTHHNLKNICVRVDQKILRGYKIILYKIIKNNFGKIYFYFIK